MTICDACKIPIKIDYYFAKNKSGKSFNLHHNCLHSAVQQEWIDISTSVLPMKCEKIFKETIKPNDWPKTDFGD